MDGFRPLTLIQAGEAQVLKQLQSGLAQNWPRLVSAGESHCKTSLQGVRRSSEEVKLLSRVRLCDPTDLQPTRLLRRRSSGRNQTKADP